MHKHMLQYINVSLLLSTDRQYGPTIKVSPSNLVDQKTQYKCQVIGR